MPDILPLAISAYVEHLVPRRPAELQAMEQWAREHDFPIIGPACGHLCYQVARMIGARRVFELGSGYGYSTAFFARAVEENGGGIVHHVVWDEELSARARRHLGALGHGATVDYHVGEAVAALRQSDGNFDLIFNDIEKTAYPESLPVIAAKLRPGGVLIIDNMLWSGRVADERDQDPATRAIREVTERITSSGDWTASLVPLRDGMIVAHRRG